MRAAVLAAGAVLLFAPPATAAPDPAPLRVWSLSKVEQGLGKVPVASDTQVSGTLDRIVDLGGVSLHPHDTSDRAIQQVSSSADGARSSTTAVAPSFLTRTKGGVAQLDTLQAYVKRADRASLGIAISGLLLHAIDANGTRRASECPGVALCTPIRAVARFRARAYTADEAFFDVGGAVYLEGYQGHWAVGAATASDARGPFWKAAQLDIHGSAAGSEAKLELHRDDPKKDPKPVTLTVPLGAVGTGEQFAVHVRLDAEAIDGRGGESYVSAFIRDPRPGLTTHGLNPRGAPKFKEPAPVRPRPATRCRAHAGTVQFSDPAFAAGEGSGTALVLVTRTGGSRGAASVVVRTGATRTPVRFEDRDTSPRLVEIPIREDLTVEPPETFTVSLAQPACAGLGARRSATVTIVDDDELPATPSEAPPAVAIPQSPAPVVPVATPSGLDPTFGSGGRVSTPVGGGQGEAVVIQPGGGIVTAGWRTVGAGTDFALTRHDASGRLDGSFGAGGIATTDLGGTGDRANDAALLGDGGIVAVGRTDAAGIQKTDFGVVRYTPDGAPAGPVIRTDILGGGDQANAVAVQPDGKIVVAGFAIRNGIDSDFALVRYHADGSLDDGFGDHGVVTTDLGTRSDDARALALQPDGRIVAAGSAGDHVALARYTAGGKLDATFGHAGITHTDLGSDSVANGVALMPGGEIEIAGSTLGAHANRDFLLARYRPDGALDPGFAPVKTDVGGGDDFAENLVIDARARTILVGRATSATILDMALVRYNADGTLDMSFDGDGIVTADFHGRGEFGQDLALDAAGRIIAAGFTANGADTEFALMRANP